MKLIQESKDHLELVGETYAQHGRFAIRWGFFLVWTGVASIVHGIFPSLFPFTAPRNILKLKALMDQRSEEERIERHELSQSPVSPQNFL